MQTVCIDRYKHKFQTMIPLTSPYLEDCSVKSKCTFKYEKKKKKDPQAWMLCRDIPLVVLFWGLI